MNLTIKRQGGKQESIYKLMDGDRLFCTTKFWSNAILIQNTFKDEIINVSEVKEPDIEKILETILRLKGIDLKTNFSQKKEIVNLRFIYCKIANDWGATLFKTGELINRKHDRVLNAVRKCENYYKNEYEFRKLYNEIKSRL